MMKKLECKPLSKNRILKALALSVCGSVSTGVNAALPADAVLVFNPGVAVNGYYGIDVVGGSYFAMDTNGDGSFTKYERIAIEANEGVKLGEAQPASGSHSGSPDNTELPSIDEPWLFFGNTGMHQTKSPVVIVGGDDGTGDGTATLDFSGWGVTWSGIPNVNLGATGTATLSCLSDCSIGDSFELTYTATIPLDDPSGFGGVSYQLHLEGTVQETFVTPPTRIARINLPDGNLLECTSHDGSTVEASAEVVTTDINDIASIDWIVDGTVVGSGESVSFVRPLGSYSLELTVNTVSSGVFQDSTTIVVRDTTAPELDILFVDKRTGAEITEVAGNGKHRLFVNYDVSDLCDPDVSATGVAVPVHTIDDGSLIKIHNKKLNKASLGVSAVNVSAEATDASGNRTSKSETLLILD